MPAQLQIDAASTSAQSTLDSLFGTAGQALDLWSQWSSQKVANTQAKAAIPATVAQPTPPMNGGISKNWLIGGAIALGLLVVVVLFRPRR